MECMKCHNEIFPCEVRGCNQEAEYEGWYRGTDPFTGKPIPHIILIKVCEEHINCLISADKKENKI